MEPIEYAGFSIRTRILRGKRLFRVYLPLKSKMFIVESLNVFDCNAAIDSWIETNF